MNRSKQFSLSKLITLLYGWACERLYHEWAWSYDVVSWLVSAGRWRVWRNAASIYTIGPNVLELGFGTGELLLELARQHGAVSGVDLSPQMLSIAQHKAKRSGCDVRLCQGEAQALPFADRHFQSIVSTFPAPYILDPATLKECARLLAPSGLDSTKPKGRLIIVGIWVTPHRPQWLRHFPVFFGQPSSLAIQQLSERFSAAGLVPSFEHFHDTWADVSIIIAERE